LTYSSAEIHFADETPSLTTITTGGRGFVSCD